MRLMETHVEATVMNGTLLLDLPLSWPDRCRVRVTVAPLSATTTDEWDAFLKRSRETPINTGVPHFNRDELYERD